MIEHLLIKPDKHEGDQQQRPCSDKLQQYEGASTISASARTGITNGMRCSMASAQDAELEVPAQNPSPLRNSITCRVFSLLTTSPAMALIPLVQSSQVASA